ncbi:MAG: M14 family zinc carboxypeptidase, partial [Candidatus Cloacimonadaceae bacterium]|nr:M14 family zinc carboxypeptidase [Candidatus Cloacimonadaceae bacterium]
MKSLIIAILLLTAVVSVAFGQLPTCYHTYDEIVALMNNYEAQYPDQAKVHLLGYSQEDQIPIYGIKISNNVLLDQDQPSVLFVGQVHAEEVLGVEITLSNIKEILQNSSQNPYNVWLAQLEMWFVPTLNPEGHNVVTSNMDTSFRKNKRDNNGNGIFDFSPLVGYDIDGVDINRNFGYNWVHGDTLMQPGGLEYYDYYRGPAPMSESEVQAIQQLSEQKKFTYSICWHSSRTGNLSEKIYYSFNWKEVRPSPDVAFAQSIAQGVASQIMNEAGTANYEFLPNLGRKGNFHDWMYQQYGTIQLLIEVGTSNLQPDSLLMVNTIQRASNGVRWLLNRALPFSTAVNSNSMLTGLVQDADNNQPLEAEIIVEQRHAPWFRPRMSKPETGRYYRPIAPGTFSVRARKKGYYDTYHPQVVVNANAITPRNIAMQARPPATLSGWVRSSGQAIPAQIILHDIDPDTLAVNGNFVLNTYQHDSIKIEITAEGYFPYIDFITINPGVNTLYVDLSQANDIFSENWENGVSNWLIEGPWVLQNELSASGYAITDSWGGKGLYAMNCDVHIQTAS